MKQSVGQTYLIYFISIFILIVFAFLIGIMNYMKAFKVNSAIANALENYEGFNTLASAEINNKLGTLGYRNGSNSSDTCSKYSHGGEIKNSPVINHEACITELKSKRSGYFKYGITTFIYIDLPWIDEIKLPIYSESNDIYDFEGVVK